MVGHFDTRFRGYGVEDGEWTTRFRREGFGIVKVPQAGGGYVKANAMIAGGVETLDAQSSRNNANVQRNREIFASIREEPTKRPPWRDVNEQETLMLEMRLAIERLPRLSS